MIFSQLQFYIPKWLWDANVAFMGVVLAFLLNGSSFFFGYKVWSVL